MDWLTHVITPLPEHFDGKKPSVFWKNETRKTTQIHAVMFPIFSVDYVTMLSKVPNVEHAAKLMTSITQDGRQI